MSKLKIAFQLPFNVLFKRMVKRILPKKKINYLGKDERILETELKINDLIGIVSLQIPQNLTIAHYLNHEFDLLGSGRINRNLDKELVQHPNHQQKTKEILSLIDKDYELLNWQLDIKSGFEFDVRKQFDEQVIDHSKKVDVKNCWELGRMQYLPQIALAGIQSAGDEKLINEFKNQVLNFVASNPVGMGIQWACAMDVAIRVSNFLISYNIINQINNKEYLNNKFNQVFLNSIYQHGKFIYDNLEQKEGAAGNHYLFNLAGLLFVSSYLSETYETKKWQDFAEIELEKEFEKQFFNDGGNFEGSITYHCLSAESMLYATALMLRNGKQLSQLYIDRIYKAANFIKTIIKANGEVPQFGDNDSGRLFKLNNEDKNLLSYESLLAGFAGLFKKEFDEYGEKYPLHKSIIEQLANNQKLEFKDSPASTSNFETVIPKLEYLEETVIEFSKPIDIQNIEQLSYPDFGMYIFKSEQFYLAISAICNKKMHHSWGHVHNDKLSFELQVNGLDLVKDPGTYTYSAIPEIRNELRSTHTHHGIIVEEVPEQNNFNKERYALTYMDREITCKLVQLDKTSISLQADYYGVTHVRKFEIFENKLVVSDYCNKPFKVNINQYENYSPNYGIIEKLTH